MRSTVIRTNCSRLQKLFITTLSLLVIVGFVSQASADKFPHRKDFPAVATIDSEKLIKEYEANGVVIVDVRSEIEYNVIHPKGAVHVPISNVKFAKNVESLIQKNPGKKIVFYCNGVTCLKSYKAAQKAREAGLKNCFAYDAGIPEWASLFPENTLLLGKKVVDPEKQIIPKSEFKKKCDSFEDFKAKLASSGGIAIDVRDARAASVSRLSASPWANLAMVLAVAGAIRKAWLFSPRSIWRT